MQFIAQCTLISLGKSSSGEAFHVTYFLKSLDYHSAVSKGQIISECPYEIIVYPKIAPKKFPRFLSWKFTTSRLTQKDSLCSVCKKIDSVLY